MINSLNKYEGKKMILRYDRVVRLALLAALLVLSGVSVQAQVTITAVNPHHATVGLPYADSIFAHSVPNANYTWTVGPGSIPAWATSRVNVIDTHDSYFVIEGTPPSTSSNTFTVKADNTLVGGSSGQDTYQVTINALAAPNISVTSLPPWTQSAETQYSEAVTVADGAPGFNFQVTANAVPTGMVFDTLTGVLSGTATATFASNFDITVTDTNGAADVQNITMTINPSLSITSGLTLTDALLGSSYSDTIVVTGGTGKIKFDDTAGVFSSLGLTLNDSTGIITGTPNAATVGAASIGMVITDQGGDSLASTFSLTVEAPPSFDAGGCNQNRVILENTGLCALAVTEPNGESVTFALLSGAFPTGITMNGNGTFTSAASYSICASDADTVTFLANIQACDPGALCDTLLLEIKVANNNRLPTMCTDSSSWVQTVQQGTTPNPLCATDPDGDNLTFVEQSAEPNNLELQDNGTWTGTVAFNVSEGWKTFNVRVTDINNDYITKVCSLYVTPDADPPYISTAASRSSSGVITVGITDDNAGVDTAYMNWRFSNSGESDVGTNVAFAPTGTNGQEITYQATVSNAELQTRGMEISIYMADNRVPTNDTTVGWISMPVSFASGTNTVLSSNWLGNADTLWHLVSFPGDYGAGASVHGIFENLSGFDPSTGTNSNDDWRLVEISGGQPVVQNSVNEANLVKKGKGYWFRHFVPPFTLKMPAGNTAASASPFSISLTSGWNLVGIPYRFAVQVSLDSLSASSLSSFIAANPAGPGAVRSTWTKSMASVGSNSVRMDPWQGYAINCESASGCVMRIDPHFVAAKLPSSSVGWTMDISVLSGGRLKDVVTIGHASNASDGPDIYDIRPGGFIGGSSDVVLKNDANGVFARDIRSGAGLQQWDLELGSGVFNGSLNWSKIDLGDGLALVLRDVVMNKTVDMTETGEFVIGSPEQLPTGRFVIYFGDEDEVMAASRRSASTLPEAFDLYQNYPNPFNPSTTVLFDVPKTGHVRLEIFNVLGQSVKVIADQTFAAGSHAVEWDGRTDKNAAVASGLYFARMVATDFSKSVTMMLIK